MHLTKTVAQQLADSANDAVADVLRNGGAGAPTPTSEPDAVACVVQDAVPEISASWSRVLGKLGFTTRVAGAFVHKSPKVLFQGSVKKNSKCELADLLIVVDELTSANNRQRRAVLVQAKNLKNGRIKIVGESEKIQHDLYKNWPPFEFEKVQKYGAGLRDLRNSPALGAVQDSGRYGLIELAPKATWHQSTPLLNMTARSPSE